MNLFEKSGEKESSLTMLASEKVFRKEWDNKADERWNNDERREVEQK